MKKLSFLISLLVCIALVSTPAFGDGFKKSKGQTLLSPANHSCYWWMGYPCAKGFGTNLFIRNIDLDHPITLTEVILLAPDGSIAYDFDISDLELLPLNSKVIRIPGPPEVNYWDVSEDRPGFFIKWTSEQRVRPPMIYSTIAAVRYF